MCTLRTCLVINKSIIQGCGVSFEDHHSWEEHIRDMVELEDTEHTFYTQVEMPPNQCSPPTRCWRASSWSWVGQGNVMQTRSYTFQRYLLSLFIVSFFLIFIYLSFFASLFTKYQKNTGMFNWSPCR